MRTLPALADPCYWHLGPEPIGGRQHRREASGAGFTANVRPGCSTEDMIRLIDRVSWVTIIGTIAGVVGAAAVIAALFPL